MTRIDDDANLFAEIDTALGDGALLLTQNANALAQFRVDFARRQAERGRDLWESGDCLTLRGWLRQSWPLLRATDYRRWLLSPTQEAAIWEQVIAEHEPQRPVGARRSLAQRAAQAWALMRGWRVPAGSAGSSGSEPETGGLFSASVSAYLRWSSAFETRVRELNAVPMAALPDAAAELLSTAPLPSQILLWDWAQVTPAEQALLDALSAEGVAMRNFRRSGGALAIHRHEFRDFDAELTAAAVWARKRLFAHPHQTVGIVVPQLAARQYRVAALIGDVFEESADAGLTGEGAGMRNAAVAMRLPLSSFEWVQTALFCASWSAAGELAWASAKRVLLNGAVAPAADGENRESGTADDSDRSERGDDAGGERRKRIMLIDRLARDGHHGVELSTLLRYLKQADQPHASAGLRAAVYAVLENRPDPARQATAASWVEHLARELTAWGLSLPAGQPQSVQGQRVVQAFYDVMRELAGLQRVAPGMTWGEFVRRLQAAVAARSLLPRPLNELAGSAAQDVAGESPSEPLASRVEVIDANACDGRRFDAVWLMGLDDAAWPPSPPTAASALLPTHWLRRAGVPQATPGDWADWNNARLQRLIDAASLAVLSCAQSDGDTALQASAFLQGFTLSGFELADAVQPFELRSAAGLELASVAEDHVGFDVAEPAPGGARLLELQSKCPFRAFAELRLGAKQAERAEPWADRREQGSLIHRVLELSWAEIRRSPRLLELMQSNQLKSLVGQFAQQAVDEATRRNPAFKVRRFAQIEVDRLVAQVQAFLEAESRRPGFTAEWLEEKREVQVGELRLNVKIDRVDRLEDGSRLVIDYKTSDKTSPSLWLGDRPDEPQLPLYATCALDDVSALAFAPVPPKALTDSQRRSGKSVTTLNGVADPERAEASGVVAFDKARGSANAESYQHSFKDWDWAALLKCWRERLENHANGFAFGDARVLPKSPQVCKYCHLSGLCRIQESALTELEEGATEGEEARD